MVMLGQCILPRRPAGVYELASLGCTYKAERSYKLKLQEKAFLPFHFSEFWDYKYTQIGLLNLLSTGFHTYVILYEFDACYN